MLFLAVGAAGSGLVLLFLSREPNRFRLIGGLSSLFSAAYIYGMAESLEFVEKLGMLGFSWWLGSLLLLLATLIYELSIAGKRMKAVAIACLLVSAVANVLFAFLFAQAAGLGIV
jgi:hypothetical protein